MTSASFAFSPQVGAQVLTTYAAATSAPVLSGGDAQQGLMAALVNAEMLASARGFATPITVGNETGVIIGGARARAIDEAKRGNEAAIIYLAQQARVRAALATTIPVSGATPTTQLVPAALPLVPILVTIAVVAVAASVAVVGWAHEERVRAEVGASKQVAVTDQIVRLAAAGQPIDPKVLESLRQIAITEASSASSLIPWPLALGIAAAVGIAIWFDHRRGL